MVNITQMKPTITYLQNCHPFWNDGTSSEEMPQQWTPDPLRTHAQVLPSVCPLYQTEASSSSAFGSYIRARARASQGQGQEGEQN